MRTLLKILLVLIFASTVLMFGCVACVSWLAVRMDSSQPSKTTVPDPPKPEPSADIQVVRSNCRKGGFGLVLVCVVTLKNIGTVTYADIGYRVIYYAASEKRLGNHEGEINEVLKPGESRTFRAISGGVLPAQTKTYVFSIRRGNSRVVNSQ